MPGVRIVVVEDEQAIRRGVVDVLRAVEITRIRVRRRIVDEHAERHVWTAIHGPACDDDRRPSSGATTLSPALHETSSQRRPHAARNSAIAAVTSAGASTDEE